MSAINPVLIGQEAKALGGTVAGAAQAANLGISFPGSGTLQSLSNFLNPELWKRIGVIVLGVYVMYLGVLVFVAGNKDVQTAAESAVGTAAKGALL